MIASALSDTSACSATSADHSCRTSALPPELGQGLKDPRTNADGRGTQHWRCMPWPPSRDAHPTGGRAASSIAPRPGRARRAATGDERISITALSSAARHASCRAARRAAGLVMTSALSDTSACSATSADHSCRTSALPPQLGQGLKDPRTNADGRGTRHWRCPGRRRATHTRPAAGPRARIATAAREARRVATGDERISITALSSAARHASCRAAWPRPPVWG